MEQVGSVFVTDPCACSERSVADDAVSTAPATAERTATTGVEPLSLPVARLDPGLPLPAYAKPGDAGLDLRSRVGLTIEPGERALVPTGVAIALPSGYAAFVHPRSGLAARHGIGIVNAPGTVDAGYRGEIMVNLVNFDPREPFVVSRGDRIAQIVVQRVETVALVEVDSLDSTPRGDTGHGSTGGFGPAARPATW